MYEIEIMQFADWMWRLTNYDEVKSSLRKYYA